MPRRSSRSTGLVPLSLTEIFPLCDPSPACDNTDKIDAAYQTLFKEAIPGFKQHKVPFVLAEVLALDRQTSRPRVLVFSNKDEKAVHHLVDEYFNVIGTLREDEWSISKTDALYTSSRIWCAETTSARRPARNIQRNWVSLPGPEFPAGYQFEDKVAHEAEVEEIDEAFKNYIDALYSLHLKNYPFAYVMLVPIFLGSIHGGEKRKKLGAVFLHFGTTTRIVKKDLLRLYSSTLFFWHYYFTSEAVERRQLLLEESKQAYRSLETENALFKRIQEPVKQIRLQLAEISKPLRALEAEFNPTRLIMFAGEDLRHFFQSGPAIEVMQQRVVPMHDWDPAEADACKTLVAGILIRAFGLEYTAPTPGASLWEEMSRLVTAKANEASRVHGELISTIPELKITNPTEQEVKKTFKLIKSWFSDAFKVENSAGLPVTLLEFAFKVWGCDFEKNGEDARTVWVASRTPVQTIEALKVLGDKQGLRRASVHVKKERTNGRLTTSCDLSIELERTHHQASEEKSANLTRLRDALNGCHQRQEEPRGDTSRFLWKLSGGKPLSLTGTVFELKEKNSKFAVDFADPKGNSTEMRMIWSGEINL
jgi:hypothetical protein